MASLLIKDVNDLRSTGIFNSASQRAGFCYILKGSVCIHQYSALFVAQGLDPVLFGGRGKTLACALLVDVNKRGCKVLSWCVRYLLMKFQFYKHIRILYLTFNQLGVCTNLISPVYMDALNWFGNHFSLHV